MNAHAKPETNEVALTVEKELALVVLTDGAQFDAFYAKVKAETDAHVPDVTTAKGREAIKSLAFKVTKTKTAIDNAGKLLTEEWRTQTQKVDASRKAIRDKLDALRDEVRRPLTEWEEAEEGRIAECKRQIAALTDAAVVSIDDSAQTVADRLDEVRGRNLDPTLFGIEFDLAQQRRDHAVSVLMAALERLKREEADRAELERLRRESEEREAAEAARREEEDRKREEAERARRAHAEQEAATARAEQERQQAARATALAAEEAAARAAQEASERAAAEQKRRDAEHEAALDAERRRADEAEAARLREAEQAQAQERDRVAAEAEQRRAADARAADIAHRSAILRAAKEAVMEHCGFEEGVAKDVLRAIAAGLIPHVAIDFTKALTLKAMPGRCEEASPLSGDTYIPCNGPAVSMVGWPARGEGPYRMCAKCASHNTRNRGATVTGPFVAEAA